MKRKWISMGLAILLALTPSTPVGAELSSGDFLYEDDLLPAEEEESSYLLSPEESSPEESSLAELLPEESPPEASLSEGAGESLLIEEADDSQELFSSEDSLEDFTLTSFSSENLPLETLTAGDEGLALLEDVPMVAANEGSSYNYLHSSKRRPEYHTATVRSDSVTDFGTGVHKDTSGIPRYYKEGRYLIDGAISANGSRYYADESGVLLSGWLKTAQRDVASTYDTVLADLKFRYRYYDPETYEMVVGYRVIDGIPHYFNPDGALIFNQGITIDGNLYYADHYGCCAQVKLAYGNIVKSIENQNNDAYLARKQVTAVNPNTFLGQDGAYSFYPRWYADRTTAELFGSTVYPAGNDTCILLCDKSLRGKMGIHYQRVGTYKGREIDLTITVDDWNNYALNGDREIGMFLLHKGHIGLSLANLRSATVTARFFDHETQRPVTLKSFATFSDIDITQSITILSPVDEVFVSDDCMLYKDPNALAFTAPFEIDRSGSRISNADMAYWVQANYTSDHLTYRFGSSHEQYRFADTNQPINCANWLIWEKDYSGNPDDYNIANEEGAWRADWQGLYFQRLGRISISPLSKTVSDSDELHVTENRLAKREEPFTYTLSHPIQGETESFYYNSYTLTDQIPSDLRIREDSLLVTDEEGQNVTDRFQCRVQGQQVTFAAKGEWLSQNTFYDTTYHYEIGVTLRTEVDLSSYTEKDYEVRNKGVVSFTRMGGEEQIESNEVVTRIRVEPAKLPVGELLIQKKILESEILWAHGNPTFLFCADGVDQQGLPHRYECSIVFTQGSYQVDANGYAILETTIPNVPLGTYGIRELPVLDYTFVNAAALTANLTIDTSLCGNAVLTKEQPKAGISYVNRKSNYSRYRHNHLRTNHLSLAG